MAKFVFSLWVFENKLFLCQLQRELQDTTENGPLLTMRSVTLTQA
jgi:hypothetical protein